MGRTLPVECQHGVTIDHGDFGPCQDCSDHALGDCPNIVECEQCEAESRPMKASRRFLSARIRHLKRKQLTQGERLREAKAERDALRSAIDAYFAEDDLDTAEALLRTALTATEPLASSRPLTPDSPLKGSDTENKT